MVRLIINILFLIVLAVFIALNVSHTTSVNIFGHVVENVSVVAVILLSIVLGVMYSFLFYITSYFGKVRKGKLKEQTVFAKKKEKELKTREKNLLKSPAGPGETMENGFPAEDYKIKPSKKAKKGTNSSPPEDLI